MNLTAKIHKVFDTGVVKAIASVNIDDAFAVHGVKVLSGKNGDNVVMPSVKHNDKYQDTFHPISREAREQISTAVLDAYRECLARQPSHEDTLAMSQAM
jgi:stage V sporulation protein G